MTQQEIDAQYAWDKSPNKQQLAFLESSGTMFRNTGSWQTLPLEERAFLLKHFSRGKFRIADPEGWEFTRSLKSKLVEKRSRKRATILTSKRTVEDAIRRANALGTAWMEADPNDPRIDELQRIVDHLSSVFQRTPQQMSVDGVSSVEDYFDDAVAPQVASTIKREVNQIAKWHDEQRGQQTQPATPQKQEAPASYVPDSAVVTSSEENMMPDKKANNAGGAGFVTDRDEKGEAKAPEKLEVPRLAKKKKEAVPEDPAAVAPPAPAAAMPAPEPAADGSVNPIDYIPTETLIKVIEDMPKEEDFAQNKNKQDALIALTEILKARPIMPPEQPEVQAQAAPAAPTPVAEAPAAPLPVAASKKADYGDHAIGGDGTIGGVGSGSPSASNNPIGVGGGGTGPGGDSNPAPEKAKIDLGGLTIAGSVEEKTADDYRIHDFKLQDEGIVPSGKLPDMDEQEQRMHPEEREMEASMDKEAVAPPHSENVVHALKDEPGVDNPFAVAWSMHNKGDKMSALKAAVAAVGSELDKLASGNGSGAWSTDQDKGEVTESGGRTPEVEEAHSMREDNTGIQRPETTRPIKLAAEITTSKAVKQSESLGNDLKKMYLDAKSLTQVNDTRAVREAVESIFRAADMFDEATKTLNKQQQQEESEAAAQDIKAKNKKSSFAGLALAASE